MTATMTLWTFSDELSKWSLFLRHHRIASFIERRSPVSVVCFVYKCFWSDCILYTLHFTCFFVVKKWWHSHDSQSAPSLRKRGSLRRAPHLCVQFLVLLLVVALFCVYVAVIVTMSLNSTNDGVRKKSPVTVPKPVTDTGSFEHNEGRSWRRDAKHEPWSSFCREKETKRVKQSKTTTRYYIKGVFGTH